MPMVSGLYFAGGSDAIAKTQTLHNSLAQAGLARSFNSSRGGGRGRPSTQDLTLALQELPVGQGLTLNAATEEKLGSLCRDAVRIAKRYGIQVRWDGTERIGSSWRAYLTVMAAPSKSGWLRPATNPTKAS